MKKVLLLIPICFLCVLKTYSQDVIILSTGEEVKAIIKEVNDTHVNYQRFESKNGALYKKSLKDIIEIKYEDGHVDTFNSNIILLGNESLKDIATLTKKGNKVFVEILNDASRAGERYFIDALKEWGYWTVVENENEAHFIIEFNIGKKAMLNKASWAVLKTRDGQEFFETKTYTTTTNAFNGFNAFRKAAKKIVDKSLKKEFKK